MLKHRAFTLPTSESSAVRICSANLMLSYSRREFSLQTGMVCAFSHSSAPASSAPANHSERVIAKTFKPAARIAVISLLRCSEPSAYMSESSRLIGRTIGTSVGTKSA